ncbi:MAG: M20 family metallopeptidase [bacterium]
MMSLESPLGLRAVRMAQRLVQTPSVNPPGDVRACAHILQEAFQRSNITTELLETEPGRVNVIARIGDAASGPVVLLNGHLDVVPPTADWEGEAFSGRIADGMLIGRGAVDMKSGLAAMVAVMEELRARGLPRKGQVVLAAVADEETGSRFGTRSLLERGLEASSAIVGEPTNLQIANGNRGSLLATVTFRGKAGHAARPSRGVNAISAAAVFISQLESFHPRRTDARFEVSTPSLTVTMIQGGVKSNVVPDRASVTLDRRTLPGESGAMAEDELRQVLDRTTRPGIRAELHVRTIHEPYILPEDASPVVAMKEACRRVLQRAPQVLAKAEATDASYLWHLAHIPTIIFGPGDPTLAHSSGEAVPVEQIAASAHAYLEAVRLLTEVSPYGAR